MDTAILSKQGITPSYPRKGYLKDYTIKIGNRASLVPAKHEKAYGIVMTIDPEVVKHLYAEASVADYIPEAVSIISETNEIIPATCYNLPLELISGTNEVYAKALYTLAERQGFPENYLEKIKGFTVT